ncbi:hypothetical protein PC9H_009527 [Pleurotus ostreatus]|uniref:Poly(A)+ RNA export protein n=2 Tax=Pleurotus TaxID=5320 RepID=A0A8H6ZPV7_PLEOS|nr:uncharacterized protein PC9H_009527 [Pleurotus ostreatus]KAF7424222.1 hypothetical protein PC9H_009527 [Pleurotus ostreatus]KAG9224680.1 hypothetical protein CCMSSC00406_0002169 [Pleurotus cornucopiae]
MSTESQRDVEAPQPPSDSISSMSFSGRADYLAAGSWDNSVRIYEVDNSLQSQYKAMYSHRGPVLSVCWNSAGDKLFSGGADNAGLMFDPFTGQSIQVAQHDAPIKAVKWIDSQSGILATGSWDRTIKYWDLRTPNAIGSVQLPERLYSMDVLFPLMVVGTAARHIEVFDFRRPNVALKSAMSPLKFQTRVVACCTASPKPAYVVGSVEGRLAVEFVDQSEAKSNYTFRCHREDKEKVNGRVTSSFVYAVNDISFHPTEGTFASAGSDGNINIWDKDARCRLPTPFKKAPAPISSTCFNRTGGIFAYAISYEWSKGHIGMMQNLPNKIMLHAVKDSEVTKRKPL